MIHVRPHSNPHVHAPSLLAPGLMPLFTDSAHEEAESPVTLRHLKTAREIEAVLPLRGGIDLSAHSGAADFASLEKKETSWVLSAHLNVAAA